MQSKAAKSIKLRLWLIGNSRISLTTPVSKRLVSIIYQAKVSSMKGKYHIRGAGAWASKKDFACMNTSLFTWERHLCNIPRATKAVNHECNKDDILVAKSKVQVFASFPTKKVYRLIFLLINSVFKRRIRMRKWPWVAKMQGWLVMENQSFFATPIGFQLWQCQVLWVIEARAMRAFVISLAYQFFPN